MQGKILIIDGISTNRIVLKVKLSAAFYHVMQASTIAEALNLIHTEVPDLIITAVALPDGSASQLCRRLHSQPRTASMPVLAISCRPDAQVRLETLRAGAFDVMDKPVNETLLLGRVRNMIRSQNKLVEWQTRDDCGTSLGLAEAPAEFVRSGNICLIGQDVAPLQSWLRHLVPQLRANYGVAQLRHALEQLHAGAAPDAVVLAQPDSSDECLRLISALRASAHTRDIALIVVQHTQNPQRATSALDMGADDVMTGGFDAQELALRLRVLMSRKRQVARMLQRVRNDLREVVHDPLTGLYNRRYAMPFLTRMIENTATSGVPFAVILADLDHFKRINDRYGHASGDAVLVETSRRLQNVVRDGDVVARMGGEEFLVAMPATDVASARNLAHRICDAIGDTPFAIPGANEPVAITISLGLAMAGHPARHDARDRDTVDAVLDRADKALYAAKSQGRNRVTLSPPKTRPAA